jgi:adenine-specific DNA-methyltransferase
MWNDSKAGLIRTAIALGALRSGGALSSAEQSLVRRVGSTRSIPMQKLRELREVIRAGDDPLGAALIALRPPTERRNLGQFLTPWVTVRHIVDWALSKGATRLIDPGCGSGRFTLEAVRRDRNVRVIAVDIDPLATLLTRAVASCTGARNVNILNVDFTTLMLPSYDQKSAFIGNPPYARHHVLSRRTKKAAARIASELGYSISAQAGLHVFFFLATAMNVKPGDVGCYVTSAEWLDVNYGSIMRTMLLNGLGASQIWLFNPTERHFDEAMTTTAITFFEVGVKRRTLEFRRISSGAPEARNHAPISALKAASKWSIYAHRKSQVKSGVGTLRDLARVHRGAATGRNKFFVMSEERADEIGIAEFCRPVIASAKQIIGSNGIIRNSEDRLVILDPPATLDRAKNPALDSYLRSGEATGEDGSSAASSYLASHRSPWWRISAPTPPIVATYMARSAPVFAANLDGLCLLNIGHGIYPIKPMSNKGLLRFVSILNARSNSFLGLGRTYHGGLQKFEPREMEAFPFELTASEAASIWSKK